MKKSSLVVIIAFALTSTVSAKLSNASCRIESIDQQKTPKPADTIKITEKTMKLYVGNYYLSSDPKRTIVINKKSKDLYAQLSPNENIFLVPRSQTKFDLKTVVPQASIDFVVENSVVKKLIITQNGGTYEWIRKA